MEGRDIIAEKWVIDRRMEPRYQVPDSFYTEDRGAFDKGHVVRRDDVCWGYDYAEVQRANGDTFHLTNCTPQVKGFNQSGSDGIWGDLENEVQRQGKQERYCIFAGPVFDEDGTHDDDDRTFSGRDEEGRMLRVKIPQRYWKMIIARRDNRLEVFAFILRQDLSSVLLEFDVTATWRPHQVSVAELETALGGTLTFPANLHAADTHQPAAAPEIAPQCPRPRRRPTAATG
ncbi:DNA/RNA non-specific endonuclease, partial [Verrucomicrobium spinosum]